MGLPWATWKTDSGPSAGQGSSEGGSRFSVETNFLDPEIWNFSINEALLEKVLSSLERVALRLKKPFDLSLDQILKIPQIVDLSRKEMTSADVAFIEKCFASTLDEVVKQRLREGRQTVRQLGLHIREIKRSVARIERLFKRQPERIRERLRQRLAELNQGASVSEERLAEETASLIQRFDLAEEILRLKSHLDTLGKLIGPGNQGPVGKKLDFLAQEITREANTPSSKSQDIEMINEGLAIKNQMESIRQHVQNIE